MGLFDFFKKKDSDNQFFKMPLFGDLEFNNLNDYYETEFTFERKKIQVDLNFEESIISKGKLKMTANFINEFKYEIPGIIDYLKSNIDEENINEYLEFHLNELDEINIKQLTEKSNKELDIKEQLLHLIYLKRIGIYPYDEDEFAFFDFCIDEKFSNYLLVVKLNVNKEIAGIEIES